MCFGSQDPFDPTRNFGASLSPEAGRGAPAFSCLPWKRVRKVPFFKFFRDFMVALCIRFSFFHVVSIFSMHTAQQLSASILDSLADVICILKL